GRFAFPGAVQTADGPECATTPSVPSGASRPTACPVSSTALDDRIHVCVKASELTYAIFAGSPAAGTTDYYETVGIPSLPPPEQCGLTKWRDVNANQAQVLDDLAQMKSHGLPITTLFIDNPWEAQPTTNTTRQNGSACTNTGRFDERFFPDPQ